MFIVVSEVQPTSEDGPTLKTKQPKSKKQAEVDLDFTGSLDLEKNLLDIFAPPKNPKSLLLPESRVPCNTKLPEDCHYQPEDLVKLFLLPNVKVFFEDMVISFIVLCWSGVIFICLIISFLSLVSWEEDKKVLR